LRRLQNLLFSGSRGESNFYGMGKNPLKKQRLGAVLCERGMAKDAKEAFIAVTEGTVFINGQKAISPSQLVASGADISIRSNPLFVGRGALKLQAALAHFGISVQGAVAADIGAATGGFTEVLLKHGARKVYAIDTARGKLAPRIREDTRVVAREKTDIRSVSELPEKADIITIDVSLIPLREILSHLGRILTSGGEVVALFKPQYETRNPKILRHGVVIDSTAREGLLKEFLVWASENGWKVRQYIESPIRGNKGNIEYLLHLLPRRAIPAQAGISSRKV
jgi:23S rRNA (cytidine1920-2'-O)/16S rRNA (cytidine1409-2'-O)-methyltransferase